MFKKIISTLVTAAFILTIPGSSFYQAWGEGTQGAASMKVVRIDGAKAPPLFKIPVLPGLGIRENFNFQRQFLKNAARPDSVGAQKAAAGKKGSLPAAIRNLGEASGLSGQVSSKAKDPSVPMTEVKGDAGNVFETGSAEAPAAPEAVSGNSSPTGIRRALTKRALTNESRVPRPSKMAAVNTGIGLGERGGVLAGLSLVVLPIATGFLLTALGVSAPLSFAIAAGVGAGAGILWHLTSKEPYGAPSEKNEPQSKKPDLSVVLSLAALGTLLGHSAAPSAAAGIAHLPLLSAVKAVYLHRASDSAGALIGLAASQRETWTGFPRTLWNEGRKAASATVRFWGRFGLVVNAALRGLPNAEARTAPLPDSIFQYPLVATPFAALGYVLTPLAFAGRALYLTAGRGALAAWRSTAQIAVDSWPWVKRILNRFFPPLLRLIKRAWRAVNTTASFTVGGTVGLITGIAGSATFGAVLMGRPYFKYILSRDMDDYRNTMFDSVSAWILNLTAGLAGIVVGAAGSLIFTVLGLPYTLTAGLGLAYRSAETGGSVQRFFDLWRKKTLPSELGRITAMTDSFAFAKDSSHHEYLKPADGWVRLFNISIATALAPVPAAGAGLRAWLRSLRDAYRALKSGETVDAAEKGLSTIKETVPIASQVFGVIGGVVAVGAGLVKVANSNDIGALVALVIFGYPLFGVGLVAGAAVGAVLSVPIGLFSWLSGYVRGR